MQYCTFVLKPLPSLQQRDQKDQKMLRFENVTDKLDFAAEEDATLAYWSEIDAFQTSLKLSEGRKEYTFYDGPPFATGLPHYGHILAGTIKDTVTRYAHQTGHYVSRRFGWDCHGLPVEYEIDKKLKITGRDMVLEMGVANYNAECRSIVQRYTKEWEKTVTRLGRWIDFKNGYKTLDPAFMESVWWVFKTLFDKGLVYRGYKVMPYSTACGTPLSNFEAGLNYKDVSDPAVVVTFPLVTDPTVCLLAWTTTPWTLPSNLALCVGATFTYVKIIDKSRDNKCFILLEKRLAQLFPEVSKADCTDERRAELYEVVERMTGDKLVGLKYIPIFTYFSEEYKETAFRVIADAYVTEEGGTGIVHQAPAFGEDDYRVCMANGIVAKGSELPCPVDADGRYTAAVSDFKGRAVKEADNDICAHLKASGRLVMKDSYVHSYPFCWRSETPLIYKAVPSWFVSVEKVKPQLLANNGKTYWVPASVQEKRFHNWLADAKDWAISRNRFWGTPIPLWISDDLEEMVAVGSVEELFELSGVRVTDLHKEHVDGITIPSKQGRGSLKRIEEVFDCWFESGSMPYAQLHYPFENQDRFTNGFPADFIAEGLDQTRGWFYTLMVLSTCLFDKPAFKNVVVNGLVLAADGKKMSKRLSNYPDPTIVLSKYGADALRLYLINSPVVRGDVLKFQEDGVNDVVRGVLLPWYNAFRFFIQCVERWESAQGVQFKPDVEVSKSSTNDVDVWILAATLGLVKYVHEEMKAYRLYTVVPRLLEFIEELTNWYVRLNRDRLKGALGDQEALLGLNVLFEVLVTMTQIMSPFTPFFAEYLYQNLRKLLPLYGNTDPAVAVDAPGKASSVHYLMLPELNVTRLNPRAEARFKTLQQAVTLARIARERRHIRNNLPLKDVLVVAANEADVEALVYLKGYFMGEINAWNVTMSTEWEKLCALKVLPNWKDLGKRLGKQMKDVAKEINELTQQQVIDFMNTGVMTVCGFELNKEDVVVKREFSGDAKRYEAAVSEDGSLMIAIDTTCDEEVLQELRAKTIAATVQRLRKSAGLVVADRVEIFYEEGGAPAAAKGKAAPAAGAGAGAAVLGGGSVAASLLKYVGITVARVKSLPLPLALCSPQAITIVREVVNDPDISKGSVTIVLTQPCVAVDSGAIGLLIPPPALADATQRNVDLVAIAAMYVQSMDSASLMASPAVRFVVEKVPLTLTRGVHYFATANEMVSSGGFTGRSRYPYLPAGESA